MILLRHGQSEFNLHLHQTGKDPGIPDAPLTPFGQQQAEAAAAALAGERISRILCSPYTRALQTVTPIARRLGLPVTITPTVRERFSASCDIGSPRTALALAWPQLDFGGIEEVWWPAIEEPHDQFAMRLALFRAEATALEDWRHLLVVTHWGFIQGMTGRSLDNGEWARCDEL
jgi:glucosyl-3-phosphoglycerate phosphatase